MFLSQEPPTALRGASENGRQKSAICRAILALCGDDADVRERIRHVVSVALMLVNTAFLCAATSCLELVPGWMLCSGDGDGR